MTQFNESNFIPYAQPSGTGRPATVTVLAIIGIVFGGWGMLSGLAGIAVSAISLMSHGTSPFMPAMQINHSALVYGLAAAPIQLALHVAEIIGCIGALSLKAWARKTMIIWSIATIVFSIAAAIVQAVWITPLTMRALAQVQPNNPIANTHFVAAFSYGGALVSVIFSCILPTLFLVLWNRDDVKNAFRGIRTA